MNITYKLETQKEYRELYYLNCLNKLRHGFFQRNGFAVSPKAIMKNSAELVFPKFRILAEKDKLEEFFRAGNENVIYPWGMVLTDYKKFGLSIPELTAIDIDLDSIETQFELKKRTLLDYLRLIGVTKNVELMIFPVNFGTSKTFLYSDKATSLQLSFTWRYDLGIEELFSGVIPASILYKLDEASENFTLEKSSIEWAKRQYLIDFLSTQTSIGTAITHTSKISSTTYDLNALTQYATIMTATHKYLQELGFDVSVEFKLSNNVLVLNEQKILLTELEAKLFTFLAIKKNQICSFDEIGDVLWDGQDEKFSIYSISKHISNIRLKIKAAGYINELIYVARGKGVLLRM